MQAFQGGLTLMEVDRPNVESPKWHGNERWVEPAPERAKNALRAIKAPASDRRPGLPCQVHYGSFASPVRPAHGGGIRLTFSFVTGTRLHGSILRSALLAFSHVLRSAV